MLRKKALPLMACFSHFETAPGEKSGAVFSLIHRDDYALIRFHGRGVVVLYFEDQMNGIAGLGIGRNQDDPARRLAGTFCF